MFEKVKIPIKTIEEIDLFEQKNIVSNYGSAHMSGGRVTFFPLIHAMVLFLSILVSSVMFLNQSNIIKIIVFYMRRLIVVVLKEVLKCNQ